jgi:SAM-dependent methyltransferase
MSPEDHLALLAGAVRPGPGVWADLGSGTGAFTIALAELLGGHGRILSVDRDRRALEEQELTLRARFPEVELEPVVGDFTTLADISGLAGIVMANSLHFQRDAAGVLRKLKAWLRPGARLVVVEYDIELPNPWVPHPVPFRRFAAMVKAAGFSAARLLESRPSRYHRRVYSAAAAAGAAPP